MKKIIYIIPVYFMLPQSTMNATDYEKLRASYESPRFAPPGWTVGFEKHITFNQYAQQAKVYYIKKANVDQKELVKKTVTEREPANIAMQKHYDADRLFQDFSYRESFYTRYFNETHQLAPNLGVYCKTPCMIDRAQNQATYIQTDYNPNEIINLHIFNAIGAAFDAKNQPDAQYFLTYHDRQPRDNSSKRVFDIQQNKNLYTTITIEKKQELIAFYTEMFDMIFACVVEHKFKRLVLSLVGTFNFAVQYPGNLLDDVFLPAFGASYHKHSAKLKNAGLEEISCMGGRNPIGHFVQNEFISRNYGYIPAILQQGPLSDKLDETLFCNAWDMHTILGNGNFLDYSLDGRFGRISAIGVLGWPKSNPHLLNNLRAIDSNTLANTNTLVDTNFPASNDQSVNSKWWGLASACLILVLVAFIVWRKRRRNN